MIVGVEEAEEHARVPQRRPKQGYGGPGGYLESMLQCLSFPPNVEAC